MCGDFVINIEYKNIKKIPFKTNRNSKFYYNKNIIYKIPKHIKKDYIRILDYINNCNIDNLIKLLDYIYKDEEFIGYSFINYNDYKALNKFKKRDILQKKEDCHKIIELFNTLTTNNLFYNDFHCGNIILDEKNNDIKLCDLDSFKIDYTKESIINQIKSSAILCLMYLYNLSYPDILVLIKDGQDINKDKTVNNYFKNLSNSNITDFHSCIDKIDLELINKEKGKLKRKCLELSSNSYYNKYYHI